MTSSAWTQALVQCQQAYQVHQAARTLTCNALSSAQAAHIPFCCRVAMTLLIEPVSYCVPSLQCMSDGNSAYSISHFLNKLLLCRQHVDKTVKMVSLVSATLVQ